MTGTTYTEETIRIDTGMGSEMPVDVEVLGDAQRARFLEIYPGNLDNIDDLDGQHVDWFVDVAETATAYSEGDIRSLSMGGMINFCTEVAKVALDLDEPTAPTTVPSDDWMVVAR